MAKRFSVFVEIGGGIGKSLTGALGTVENKLKGLGAHYKAGAAAARDAAKGILDSYKGVAALAAGSGIVFSTKHAMHDGAELAHEMQALRNAGRSAEEVAAGLREANAAIANMPTATLTNGIKILNETTGAYGDYHHAVENLQFNFKLGDVLKNTVGAEDPSHEIGSLIKMLEIRGSASNPEKYRYKAEKLAQAMVFYGGRLKADDLYTFASNAQVGVRQLNERFLTKIAPALIQEMGGDKVGTGLTAFRTIISGRKITDQKQAQAWKDLGLLSEKDIIKNKKGDVTGWKDGAIKGTRLAYQDPMEFMEKVVLPRLKAKGTDTTDPIKLGAALNTLFKNNKANSFVTAISTVVDQARLKKDEDKIGEVLSLQRNYEESLLNDPKMAEFAIKSAMTNIGASLTLGLQKPFAMMLVRIARAFNQVSHALVEHPEAAKIVAGIGAALTALAAVRLANFVFGVSGLVRALAMLSIGAPLSLAGRLIGVARGIATLAAASALSAARGLRLLGTGLWALAAFPFTLATRLRGVAAGIAALQAVGGSRLVFATMAGGLGRLGLAVLAFPLVALRAVAVGIASGFRLIGAGMWALVANPVGAVVAAIVVSLTALGVWIANNASGIKTFFGAFGESFMANLGPGASGAVTAIVDSLKSVWEWASKILGPIDESGEKWKAWGASAGKGAAAVVSALATLPAEIAKLAKEGFDALVNFDWGAAGLLIVDKIKAGLSGLGGYLVDKLNPFSGGATAPPSPGAPAPVPDVATKTPPMLRAAPVPAAPVPLPASPPLPTPRPASAKPAVGPSLVVTPIEAPAALAAAPGLKKSAPLLRATPLAGARALGGPVTKGLPYLIGERGPEIFVPDTDGKVKTNADLNGLASAVSRGPSVDVSALKQTDDAAAVTGGALHDALDATRKPIVDTTSIEAATEKATKLKAILATVGSSPINVDYEGAPGGSGVGSGVGSGGPGVGGGSLGDVGRAATAGGGRRAFMGQGGGVPNLAGGDASGAEADGIRASAKKYGIDPRVAVAVAKSEGLGTAWGSGMDHGTSFGAFQLHVGGGLGDIYQRETGHDPRDKRNAPEMNDWALKYASTHGWGPWHGAARIGVRGMAGIGGRAASGDLRGADAVGSAGDGASRVGTGLHVLNEQCVSLAKAAVGASGSVLSWRRGVSALDGSMKPGTPIATFLDRAGRSSNRYAGGGTGTMGAHLDHAGVFQSYIRNEAGKIVGFRMAEQYKGSHGVPSKAYYAGHGSWGEGNAANYSAVMGPDGHHLGGARNPMEAAAPKIADAPAAKPVAQASTPHTPGSKTVALAGARATGGPVGRGLSYLVGERGPEIFTPQSTGQISTNAALDRLTSIGSASFANMPAEFGRQVVDGSGGEPVAPSPEAVAKAKAEPSRSDRGDRRGGSFHAGVHHWNIQGGDPREIRGQVESIFAGLLRQFEDDQRGSLSD